MNIVIPTELRRLAKQFADGGARLYVVGGYVRNAVMGGGFDTDIDIASDVAPQRLVEMLTGFKVIPVHKQLGTCVIASDGASFEYTPFRTEEYAPGGGHVPVRSELTVSLDEDSSRRDFTCNSLYYSITDDEVIDPYGGVADIDNKVLRAIISPRHVFSRDGLRIMRMARLAAETGFSVEQGTLATAREMVSQLGDISPERIWGELSRVLCADGKYNVGGAHYRGLSILGEVGAWQYIAPEIEAMRGVVQNPKYHKYDVYEHTLQAVRFSPPSVRLAALFHDAGKPEAVRLHGNMYLHPEIGAEMTRHRLGQGGLRLPVDTVRETVRLVRCHMYDLNNNTREGKLRLFVAENFDIMEKLLALKRADALGTGMVSDPEPPPMARVYREMKDKGCAVDLSGLRVRGSDITRAYPDISGKRLGEVLRGLLRDVIINPALNEREILLRRAGAMREKCGSNDCVGGDADA